MEALFIIGIIVLNIVISVWNCYAVGTVWKDVKAVGTWFDKLLLWCGVIQSGVGFSLPILLVLTFGAVKFLSGGAEPALTPEEVESLLQGALSLWYVLIIFPVLGTGFIIWGYSIKEAFQRRDFTSFAIAGYNTFAQVHNTVSAAQNLGGAFANVGDFFGCALKGNGDAKGKAALLLLLLVVVSLVAGFMIAFGLVRKFSNAADSRLEQYGRSMQAALHCMGLVGALESDHFLFDILVLFFISKP